MKNAELIEILRENGVTHDLVQKYFGFSAMTFYRWQQKPSGVVTPVWENAIREGFFKLIIERKILVVSKSLRSFLEKHPCYSIQAAMVELGVKKNADVFRKNPQSNAEVFLRLIGQNEKHQSLVAAQRSKIEKLKNQGEDWERCINLLQKVTQAPDPVAEKSIAYGALYFLISPVSLIPKLIPAVAYLEHFALLCVAASYYSRAPRLTKNAPLELEAAQ